MTAYRRENRKEEGLISAGDNAFKNGTIQARKSGEMQKAGGFRKLLKEKPTAVPEALWLLRLQEKHLQMGEF